MNMRVRDFPDRGVVVWFALLAGIVVWIIHLTAFAAIVTFVHTNGYFWLFNAGNALAIIITVVATVLCWVMLRSTDADEEDGTPAGRIRFLAEFGLLVNAINLMLIALEGSYVYLIRTGH